MSASRRTWTWHRVRRDVVWVSLRQRRLLLALTVLFMPDAYSLTNEQYRVGGRGTTP